MGSAFAMSIVDNISGAYGKLERAEHHINDLRGQIDVFLAEVPFKVIAHYRRKAGKISYSVKAEKRIPPPFSFILGDAVHNLRAALDLMLFALASQRAPRPDNIQFPFPKGDSDNALTGTINSGQVKFAGEKVEEAIRRLDPRPSKNSILSGIHSLDIRDKHRLLILSRGIPNFTGSRLGDLIGKQAGIQIKGGGSILMTAPDGEDIITINKQFILRDLPDCQKEAEVQPPFVIIFGKGQPFENKIVLQVLRDGANAVRTALDEMLVAFLNPANKFP